MIAAYHKRLTGDDMEERVEAARAWSMWEGASLSLLPDPARVAAFGEPRYAIAFARIECHYFVNKGFFDIDGQLIANAGLIRHIPGVIVHGRYDLCTPVRDRLGPAPRLAGGGSPHRARQRPRDDRAGHRPRARRRDGAVQRGLGSHLDQVRHVNYSSHNRSPADC